MNIIPIISPNYPYELKNYVTGNVYPPLVLYVKGHLKVDKRVAMWQVEYALKKGKKVFILKPKYKGYKRGKIWVNYEEAYKYFVKNGAIGFSGNEIEKLVKEINEILSD